MKKMHTLLMVLAALALAWAPPALPAQDADESEATHDAVVESVDAPEGKEALANTPAPPAQELVEGDAKTAISADKASSEKSPKVAKVGSKAPDFTLTDSKGEEHKLSDFKGKTVVLSWTNPQCPFIVDHGNRGTYTKLQEKYKEDDVVILLIDSTTDGSVERTTEYTEKYKIELPVLHDFDGKVARMYDAKTTPHAYVIDPEGNLVYAGAQDNYPLDRVEEGEERIDYVDAAIQDLKADREVAHKTSDPYGCSVKYRTQEEPKS